MYQSSGELKAAMTIAAKTQTASASPAISEESMR
jgi:hypothetical protein